MTWKREESSCLGPPFFFFPPPDDDPGLGAEAFADCPLFPSAFPLPFSFLLFFVGVKEDSPASALRFRPHFFSTAVSCLSCDDSIPRNSFCHFSTSFCTASALTGVFCMVPAGPVLVRVIGVRLAFLCNLLKVARVGHPVALWVLPPLAKIGLTQHRLQ